MVPDYRIYIRNREDHIISVERVDCPTDDDSLAEAADLVSDRRSAEVWERARFVGRWCLANAHTNAPWHRAVR